MKRNTAITIFCCTLAVCIVIMTVTAIAYNTDQGEDTLSEVVDALPIPGNTLLAFPADINIILRLKADGTVTWQFVEVE